MTPSENMTTEQYAQFISELIDNVLILRLLHQSMLVEGFDKREVIAGLAYGREWHRCGGLPFIQHRQSAQDAQDAKLLHLRKDWLEDWLNNHREQFGYQTENPGF